MTEYDQEDQPHLYAYLYESAHGELGLKAWAKQKGKENTQSRRENS